MKKIMTIQTIVGLVSVITAIVLLFVSPIFAIIPACVLLIVGVLHLVMIGMVAGIGPFKGLQNFDGEVKALSERYDSNTRKGEIVFYGASNFRLWKDMEEDLKPHVVQNHGIGGSTDMFLVRYADKMLFPYDPKIVFFQTGSNEYVQLKGSDEERLNRCMEIKEEMFTSFHNKLPNAKFVVMSGLLLPGRAKYVELTKGINKKLKAYCEAHSDYMTFIDAEELTYDGENFHKELFISDGLHLNHDGQLLWRDKYIMPVLDELDKI